MATLYENITRLENTKVAIKEAIVAKGVAVSPDALIDTYAARVNEISGSTLPPAICLSGTGWDSEPFLPVPPDKMGTLPEDLEYTKQKYSAGFPVNGYEHYKNDKQMVYAPGVDMSKSTDLRYCFDGCSNLRCVPKLSGGKVDYFGGMFWGCTNLEYVSGLDFPNASSMSSLFGYCTNLKTVPEIDATNITDAAFCFTDCPNIENVGGLKNLKVEVDFRKCPKLTHVSIMNVINDLAVVKTETWLKLGTENLAKITPEEIAIATNKGWKVVA